MLLVLCPETTLMNDSRFFISVEQKQVSLIIIQSEGNLLEEVYSAAETQAVCVQVNKTRVKQ